MNVVRRLSVPLAALLLTVLPLLLFARRFPYLAPFSMFAGDAFYYLDVAVHSQGTPFYTFDGLTATNGFHPLWQGVLYAAVKLHFLDPGRPALALQHLLYLNIALVGLGTFCLTLFAMRHLREKWLALITVCPGWLWFFVALSAPDYLANWSYVNGMETSAELLLLSLVLLSFRAGFTPAGWLPLTGLLLGLLVLARLDDIFFVVPIGFFLHRNFATQRGFLLSCLTIPAVLIAGYLAYNVHSVHLLMPISGTAKAGLAVRQNGAELLKILLPIRWDTPASLGELGYSVFSERFMRCFQMVFPMFACGFYLLCSREMIGTERAKYGILDYLCVGVLLKGLYNFLFVALWSQGSWYYGPAIFTASLLLSKGIERVFRSSSLLGSRSLARKLAVGAEVLLVLISFNIFVNHKLSTGIGTRSELMLERRVSLASMVRNAGSDRFIELEDGILSFATNLESISGIGLVLDAEALAARRQGHFFDLAITRGDGLIMADGAYADALEQFSAAASKHPAETLYGIHSSEFLEYAVVPIARDTETDVRLYRLVRR